MRVALFIPCYVDQLKPEVGVASLELLEFLGIEVEYPRDQTCCGQPFLTAGELSGARALARRYVDVFDGFDVIVTPSGSCAATMRCQLPRLVTGSKAEEVAGRTRELCEFLVEREAQRTLHGSFGYRVGLHPSCHALRELRLGTASELRGAQTVDPARSLLSCLAGLEFVELQRRDECCGFGGTFSIDEEAVACQMGLDRITDHRSAGAQVLTSTDVSCLLHLDGLARRRAIPLRTLHVAEILAEAMHEQTGQHSEAADGAC